VDTFTQVKETTKFSRMIPLAEIEANDYNLNIPRYIDTQEKEDIQDLTAHLQGGIPAHDIDALAPYRAVYGSIKAKLFKADTKDGYYQLSIPIDQIKQAIYTHDEFVAYRHTLSQAFTSWQSTITPLCKAIDATTHPRNFIHTLGENILSSYSNKALIDKYSIYQHLMDYRNETMKDDLYMIIEDGRKATLSETKRSKKTIYVCDLIPQDLIINRYFMEDKNNLTTSQ